MKDIFLIRHGESSQNTGINYREGLPDHLVYITEKGKIQAQDGANKLLNYANENGIRLAGTTRVWVSPYERTRQTFGEFNKVLEVPESEKLENITLVEHQYGLFDGVPDEEWETRYPNEYANYMKWKNMGGKFYARFPCGESPFDVAIRAHQFLGTMRRDNKKHKHDTVLVFTHGTTLRALLLRMFHYSPEWFEKERNPKNCWIRHIRRVDGEFIDMGYINV